MSSIDKILEIFNYTYIIIGLYSSIAMYILYKKDKYSLSFSETLNKVYEEYAVLDIISNFGSIHNVIIILLVLGTLGFLTSIAFDFLAQAILKIIKFLFRRLFRKIVSDKVLNILEKLFLYEKKELVTPFYEKLSKSEVIKESSYRKSSFDYELFFLLSHLKIYYYDLYKFVNKKNQVFEMLKVLFMWMIIITFQFNIEFFLFFDYVFVNVFILSLALYLLIAFIDRLFVSLLVIELIPILENIDRDN